MPIKHLNQPIKSNSGKSRKSKKDLKNLLITGGIGFGALALIGFFIITVTLAIMSRSLPSPDQLLDRTVDQSTKIFDRTGEVLLYEIHGDEQRTLVEIDQIPDVMKWATVAIEDKSFYSHHGVSWKGLVRAFVVGVIKRERIGGTSTLTQQFVKNAILTNERSITRKLKELLLSLQIEQKYSKDQILQLYLNEVPYGSTMYGVESAAQGYFGKSIREISLDEAAMLAALPQSPDTYNPYGAGTRGDNRDVLIGRQEYILDQMAEQGYISQEEADEAKEIDTLEKLIPQQIGNIKAPHFVMMVREQLVEEFGQREVETGGLTVVTTLDWRLQQAAEQAVIDGVDARSERYGFSNASLVAIGPRDGQILAMVGSRDYFNDDIDGQVNVALRPRQPGSSLKPLVYATGFMLGYLPETVLWDVKTDFQTGTGSYSPNNYNLKESGPMTIRAALQGSLNIPAVKMLYLVGVNTVLDLTEKLGYTTLQDRDRYGLSLVLGGGEVKLLDHVSAYGTFANDGVRHAPSAILNVKDFKGNTLKEWELDDGERVFESNVMRLLSNVLSDNGARAYAFGASNNLTLPGRPVAAKTGTTNDYKDAWTIGYTPSIVAGVWAGNNDNAEMARGAGGSTIAAPIWRQFMIEAVKDTAVESFAAPDAPKTDKPAIVGKAYEQTVKVDTVSGKLATEFTPEEFIEEKTFYDAHSILYYVDRYNPLGDAPSNPGNDPQFANWESAVIAWVEEEGWNATSTPPTEYDDVHTSNNLPQVRVQSPSNNERINDRSFDIRVRVYAERPLRSVRAVINGYVIGASYQSNGDEWVIRALAPNALEKGFHEMTVEAVDDVGNRGSETRKINLLAEPAETYAQVTDPAPGSVLETTDFPKTVQVQLNDLSNVQKVNLYLQTPLGETRLIGSNIKPSSSPVEFNWSFLRGPGLYSIYAEVTTTGGSVIKGDKISLTIKPGTVVQEEEGTEE